MSRRLIFVCPGWGKVDMAWYIMRNKFLKADFDVIYSNYPKNGFISIKQSAETTVKALEAIQGSYDHVTFIGHSMGGLIGRYIVQVMNRHDLFDAYVSMGTPHQGTIMSYFAAWSESAREMMPRSPFYKTLHNEWPHDKIPVLTILAGLDGIVLPRASALFGGDQATAVHIKRATHTSLLVHPQVFYEIWAWLIYNLFDEVGFVQKPGRYAKFKPLNNNIMARYAIFYTKLRENLSKKLIFSKFLH